MQYYNTNFPFKKKGIQDMQKHLSDLTNKVLT